MIKLSERMVRMAPSRDSCSGSSREQTRSRYVRVAVRTRPQRVYLQRSARSPLSLFRQRAATLPCSSCSAPPAAAPPQCVAHPEMEARTSSSWLIPCGAVCPACLLDKPEFMADVNQLAVMLVVGACYNIIPRTLRPLRLLLLSRGSDGRTSSLDRKENRRRARGSLLRHL